jgi:hypothetical protein
MTPRDASIALGDQASPEWRQLLLTAILPHIELTAIEASQT